MDGVHYHKWFTQKLLPALPPESVIVIDKAPYHSVKEEKVPLMSSLKKDIQAWLSKKGLVKTVKVEGDTYCIDEIASEAGHTVVRLSPYLMQKAFVASANTTFKMKDLEPLVWKGIQQVIAEKRLGTPCRKRSPTLVEGICSFCRETHNSTNATKNVYAVTN
ncbi:hypothetical protein HPB47_019557 [Ixodes persulcatus]|uniref:Uncharacterized protein n=1 Tax=Ixodes persulcatus TaxID=34615 RepID=A0AC60QHU7_IXOPE|nr:hypothetical protein HPB47_019557 [Ixodes persulcatus]